MLFPPKPLFCATASLTFFASSAFAVSSTFDTGVEGWTGIGDIAAPLSWSGTGGNPGGNVSLVDSVAGGTTYFLAPAAFLGNQSGAIGTSLTFDLKQVFPGAADQFDAPDVILTGAGLTLAFDLPHEHLRLADRHLEAFAPHDLGEHRELELAAALDLPGIGTEGGEDAERDVADELLVEALLHLARGQLVAFGAGERRGVDADRDR